MIAAGIAISSCQEYEIDSQPGLPPTVRTDALDEYSIAAASPSRIVFNISANTPWSIETDSQWCMPSPAMSAASSLVSEIVINSEDNDTYLPRTATLTVISDEIGIVRSIKVVQAKMKEKVTFEVAGGNPLNNVISVGTGMACDTVVTFNSSKPWSLASADLPTWAAFEKISDTQLKINIAEDNTSLSERSALVRFMVQGTEDIFEFPFRIVQPAPFTVSKNAIMSTDALTGYTKLTLTKGEMFRTNYLVKKGRFIVEFEDMKMSAICNLGFVFQGTTTDANFKFHAEGAMTYWFRCAGAFTWNAPIKKPYTFDDVNSIRKIEFVVSSAAEGLIDISIYINGQLYGTQAGRTDVFSSGAEEGCVFILDTGVEPAEGDFCVIKSITYISEES